MSYHYADPHPGVPLKEITPTSERAASWLSRVANELPHDENIQLGGAVFMMRGMEHHYENIQSHLSQLQNYIDLSAAWNLRWMASIDREEPFNEPAPTPSSVEHAQLAYIAHEAVAYVNRLGQFYYFAMRKSQDSLLVRMAELMVFRKKHTAHRSIDVPRKEDDNQSQWSQAASMGGFYTMLRAGSPVFQISDSKGNWQELDILKDHSILLVECIAVLESVCVAS